MEADYDICIIGGGINGAGIARDAQGRGYQTLLIEAQDLAGATSSASTKLVHGGLRYLEHYKFKLVHESLKERAKLLGIAPHIVRPMDFILPHDAHLRPRWMIRLGLRLYDLFAGRENIKKSESVDFATSAYGDRLQTKYEQGFSYADCWVDDARLVALNALDAKERGADVLTRTAVTKIEPRRDKTGWRITLIDLASGDELRVTAGAVVNAAGPWVRKVLEASKLDGPRTPLVRLVKGSHIIVPRLYDGAHSYILQQPDKRIVFAIPYEHYYTLIGTTDVPFTDDPASARITQEEVGYLLDAANRSFKKPLTPDDVVWSYSGVRALADDGEDSASKVTRDYKLDMQVIQKAPILSVFGGKITTYRHLAEEVVNKITRRKASWTHAMPLPGGNIRTDLKTFTDDQRAKYAFLPGPLVTRLARSYGTRMDRFLDGAQSLNDLGTHFGFDVYQAEIDYLMDHEFAKTADDALWRRSKLGLHISRETIANIAAYMEGRA